MHGCPKFHFLYSDLRGTKQESVDTLISMGFRLHRASLYLVSRHNFKADLTTPAIEKVK